MPSYAIRKHPKHKHVILNALPCKVKYDGPVDAAKYWKPTMDEKQAKTVYFRGRKLKGAILKVPEGYEGHLLQSTETPVRDDRSLEPTASFYEDEDDEPKEDESTSEQPHIMHNLASFKEVIVWGHEQIPNIADDPYARAMNEWIAMAQAIHGEDEPGQPKS